MAIEHLGQTALRKPDYQEPRWDLPLNENWESIAAMLETLNTGTRLVNGLGLTLDGGLSFTIADGVIHRGGLDEPITGGTFAAQNGTTVYVYIDNLGAIQVANSFEANDIFPLYMVQASGGAIVSTGDCKNKQTAAPGGGGGLEWEKIPV